MEKNYVQNSRLIFKEKREERCNVRVEKLLKIKINFNNLQNKQKQVREDTHKKNGFYSGRTTKVLPFFF